MRYLTRRVILVLVFVLILTSVAAAQPPGTSVPVSRYGALSGLSAYVPQDALAYVAARTDTEALAALNETLSDAFAGLPPLPFNPSIEDIFEQVTRLPFDDIRPWLGDAIAMAIVPEDARRNFSDVTNILVAHLADPSAAQAYFAPRVAAQSVTFHNDVMIISDPFVIADLNASDLDPLHLQPAFTAAVGSLPARDYAALVYVDLPVVAADTHGENVRRWMNFSGWSTGDALTQAINVGMFARLFGPVAAGITRGVNDDLLLDVSMTAGNLTGLRPLGFNPQVPPPADPRMLALVPDDAFAVAQGGSFAGGMVDVYLAFGPIVKDIYFSQVAARNMGYAYNSAIPVDPLRDLDMVALADLFLGNALGVTLSDVQNWSSREYVMFARLNPDWRPGSLDYSMPIEAAGVFRVGRPEQSYVAFENLVRTLQLWRSGSGFSSHVDVDVVRRDRVREAIVTLYPDGRSGEAFPISFIVTGEYAILGSQGAAREALFRTANGAAPSWLTEAAANFQRDAAFNVVVRPSAFIPVLPASSGMESTRLLLAKIDVASMTLRVAPNGATIVRFTTGLSDAGQMETLVNQPTLVPAPTRDMPTLTAPPPMPMQPTATPFGAEQSAELTMTAQPGFIPPEATVEATLDPVIAGVTEIIGTATAVSLNLTATASVSEATPTPTPFVPSPVPTDQSALIVVEDITTGIPTFRGRDGAFTIGSPDAPYTLVVFSDWACPHCQAYHPTLRDLIANDVFAGALKIEHRTLPTAGREATHFAGRLMECAEIQQPGVFWSAWRALYTIAAETPRTYNDPALLSERLAIGYDLDADELLECAAQARQIESDLGYARALGTSSTPSVYLRDANGDTNVVQDRSLEGIRALIYGGVAMPVFPTLTPVAADAEAEGTRAAELADAAATQAAASVAAGTPTPEE